MEFPKNLKYTKDHEWIDLSSNPAIIGVTQFAVEQLGDIVHVDLPDSNSTFDSGSSFGTIESTKTVSDLYMPVGGTVKAVNQAVRDRPETVQEDPYQTGWLVKVTLAAKESGSNLLTAEQYEKYVNDQEH
jgi:glycine cleavage system H protein